MLAMNYCRHFGWLRGELYSSAGFRCGAYGGRRGLPVTFNYYDKAHDCATRISHHACRAASTGACVGFGRWALFNNRHPRQPETPCLKDKIKESQVLYRLDRYVSAPTADHQHRRTRLGASTSGLVDG